VVEYNHCPLRPRKRSKGPLNLGQPRFWKGREHWLHRPALRGPEKAAVQQSAAVYRVINADTGEPSGEAIRIAQRPPGAPSREHALLDDVLGLMRVTDNGYGEPEQAIGLGEHSPFELGLPLGIGHDDPHDLDVESHIQ
jgi:hypothetical protein